MRWPWLRSVFLAGGCAVLSVALLGASCDKKSVANPSELQGSASPSGSSPSAAAPSGPAPAQPAADGGGLKALDESQKARFSSLAEKLQSPCGKAQSLKASMSSDPSCRRASFAGNYVAKLIKMELADDEVTDAYNVRYRQGEPQSFDLKDSPFEGVPNAPVVVVEFFDYGCPHCKEKSSILEDIAAQFPSDVVIYYKHFPLSKIHKDSVNAALAAIAAQRQGKFREMHRKLFANQGSHSKDDLYRYAREVGLDMARFNADFNDPSALERVNSDRGEGERVKIEGTPTLYVNGRLYAPDPITVDDMKDWVNEEMAVNR